MVVGRALAGAWQRVVQGAKQALEAPALEKELFRFSSPADLRVWETFQDADHGGCSSSTMTMAEDPPGTAVFQGVLSSELAAGGGRLQRGGYCGVRSKLRPGERYLDLEDFDTLCMRVKGDGRIYLANIRTDNWVTPPGEPLDIWQAPIPAVKDKWTDVELPLQQFLLTWKGRVVPEMPANAMERARVLSLGIVLTGGYGDLTVQPPGPFRLEFQRIHCKRTS
eukprot:jgi/Chlat1/1457/Chrsp12S02009